MTKQEFLCELQAALSGLPLESVKESIMFYSEIIDDCMDDGMTEQEAVGQIGSVDEIASQIIAETPLLKLAKEKIKPKRKMKAWEIVLLVLGSPIWLSLLAAALVVIIAVYIVIWSVIISLWAIFASLISCAVGGTVAGIIFTCTGNLLPGIAMMGASIFCAGLSIFAFFGCREATGGAAWLTKKIIIGIKHLFVGKEKV